MYIYFSGLLVFWFWAQTHCISCTWIIMIVAVAKRNNMNGIPLG